MGVCLVISLDYKNLEYKSLVFIILGWRSDLEQSWEHRKGYRGLDSAFRNKRTDWRIHRHFVWEGDPVQQWETAKHEKEMDWHLSPKAEEGDLHTVLLFSSIFFYNNGTYILSMISNFSITLDQKLHNCFLCVGKSSFSPGLKFSFDEWWVGLGDCLLSSKLYFTGLTQTSPNKLWILRV